MYKVFFKDRIFSLYDESFLINTDENIYVFKNINQLKSLIKDFIHGNKNMTLIHTDLEELWINFKECLDTKHAAGGLVIKDDCFLTIKKWGFWDLPKGHVEEGETYNNTAIREVEEETGIINPQIIETLPCTYHLYLYNNEVVLKISHWFKMTYKGNDTLTPQIEEDITEVIWMPIDDKDKFIRNTYPTLYSTIEFV